jgi:hypothetical protein
VSLDTRACRCDLPERRSLCERAEKEKPGQFSVLRRNWPGLLK